MQVGILGVGYIGATLVQRLSKAGHQVKAANSRGPETIPADVFSAGGRAVDARDAVTDVDALIMSIPLSRIPGIRPLVDDLPTSAVLLDTSNYYPWRDSHIRALDDGQVESLWVTEQLDRPVVKAWNAISTNSFNVKAVVAGTPDRLAVPVAADGDGDRALGLALVEETGFDGFDAGTLAESWRQQPGTPAYCTDLGCDDLQVALAAAVPGRGPRRRDLVGTVMAELTEDPTVGPGAHLFVQASRLLY